MRLRERACLKRACVSAVQSSPSVGQLHRSEDIRQSPSSHSERQASSPLLPVRRLQMWFVRVFVEAADSYGRAVLHRSRTAASTVSNNGSYQPMSRVAGRGGFGIALGGYRSRTSNRSSIQSRGAWQDQGGQDRLLGG